jgi:phage terminase small subunit
MALRGRKATPIVQKLIRGNPGKRPLSTMVPAPRDGVIPCPAAVQRNARARDHWDMYVTNAAQGHLAPIDAPLLERLCLALAWADEASERMEEEGMVIPAPNTGLPIQSPYMAIVNRQTELARKLASELALPPAQRNRQGKHEAPPEDPTAEFFSH